MYQESALERALATISKNLDRMIKKERISEADKQATLDRITTFTSVEKAVASADLVVEAATENLDLKLKFLKHSMNTLLKELFWQVIPLQFLSLKLHRSRIDLHK